MRFGSVRHPEGWWLALPHLPFVPLTCASEARLQAARRDACIAGSVSPPSWPVLVRASPLALPGAVEAEASLVRHAPSGPTGSFNPCLPRRLLPKAQAGPDSDPKVFLRGASSKIRGARRSEDRHAPGDSSLLRPGKSEDLPSRESSKTQDPEDPKDSRIPETLLKAAARSLSAEASSCVAALAPRRQLPRLGPKTCAPKPGASRAQARARRLWLLGAVSSSARSSEQDPKASPRCPRQVGRSPSLAVPKVR